MTKYEKIEPETIAARFKALGDPTRLRIFAFLRQCCCPVAVDEQTGEVRCADGPTVGEVCCHITGKDHVTSTISEHLKDLRIAGLVTMEKRGKHVICGVNRDAAAALAAYLSNEPSQTEDTNDCCNGCCE